MMSELIKKFLPPNQFKTQSYLENINKWSSQNEVKINEKKSNYIIFTRCQTEFVTRLKINNKNIDQMHAIKLLGVWITEDLSWQLNCEELCKKAYKRVSLLTKLKYVGVKKEDLILIYQLFIRSCMEYCSVIYHSSLTIEQSRMLECVQRVCLKVIFGQDYISYTHSLQKSYLSLLSTRREKRILHFCHRALKHPRHKNMFPISEKFTNDTHQLRDHEKCVVNFANTNSYKNSFLPYAQRKLNTEHHMKKK